MSDSPIKILLVEDNPGDARLLQLALAEAGSGRFALTHVSTLSEGLERLAEDGIDVVLLDLSLPDSQGLETFLKAHAQAPGVPFVVMTGLADERMAISALREGAQDYLVKVLYSSSRLVTLGLLSLRLLLAEELLWGKVAQGLVRTHCVIGKLPKAELLVQGSDLQGKVIDLIELLGMGTLCPFHGTIELGRARWQYEEAKASLLTCLFKARLELGASVHLYSSYWGKGIRACRVLKKSVAVFAVALVRTSTTSQRDTTSLAVNYFSITPGRGLTSRVSTCTRSPGSITG